MQLVYWVLLLVAMPPILWEHLLRHPTVLIWVYLGLALLYLPIAMGWSPRNRFANLSINYFVLTGIGLSINAIYGWEPQPGIYMMLPAGLMAYAIHGGRGLLLVMSTQMLMVTITTLFLHVGQPLAGTVIALSTWLAIYLAMATIIWHALSAVQRRSIEREAMAAKLRESDKLLEDNERSVHHIVEVGLGEAEIAAAALVREQPGLSEQAQFVRLTQAISSVRDALGKK